MNAVETDETEANIPVQNPKSNIKTKEVCENSLKPVEPRSKDANKVEEVILESSGRPKRRQCVAPKRFGDWETEEDFDQKEEEVKETPHTNARKPKKMKLHENDEDWVTDHDDDSDDEGEEEDEDEWEDENWKAATRFEKGFIAEPQKKPKKKGTFIFLSSFELKIQNYL